MALLTERKRVISQRSSELACNRLKVINDDGERNLVTKGRLEDRKDDAVRFLDPRYCVGCLLELFIKPFTV